MEPVELCWKLEVGGGRLNSKAIYRRSLLLLNVPRRHIQTGLGDGVLLLLLLRIGKIDRGKQGGHKVRNTEGGGLSSAAEWAGCMAGEVCGRWRGGHL
eukprot:1920059-Rhodomonas_salina.1